MKTTDWVDFYVSGTVHENELDSLHNSLRKALTVRLIMTYKLSY